MEELTIYMPEMKTGVELYSALTRLPPYNDAIRSKGESERLIALADLFQIYIPSPMSTEIYSKLYLALLRSLQKKATKDAVMQYNENYRAICRLDHNGIMGGSDSFTVIGTSGIGKSSAVNRAIELLSENGIIETQRPYSKIIPCLSVQCPFDSSVKGMLLEILRKVDEIIGSDYYTKAMRVRTTTDMLIGAVSQVAINHIGLLVVDEIQNVVRNTNGDKLIAMLTQLINNSGISVCMVGTPESIEFFEGAMQLARRSLGLQYGAMTNDGYFRDFCRILFNYQYTRYKVGITDDIVRWLYDHSGGLASMVVLLIHDAQEIAIQSGSELLDIDSLNEAYRKRLTLMHGYIAPTIKRGKQTSTKDKQPELPTKEENEYGEALISKLYERSKEENSSFLSLLRQYITVEEVAP